MKNRERAVVTGDAGKFKRRGGPGTECGGEKVALSPKRLICTKMGKRHMYLCKEAPVMLWGPNLTRNFAPI